MNEIVKTDFENVENIIVLTIQTENGKQQQFTIPDKYYLENKAAIQNVMVNKNTTRHLNGKFTVGRFRASKILANSNFRLMWR